MYSSRLPTSAIPLPDAGLADLAHRQRLRRKRRLDLGWS